MLINRVVTESDVGSGEAPGGQIGASQLSFGGGQEAGAAAARCATCGVVQPAAHVACRLQAAARWAHRPRLQSSSSYVQGVQQEISKEYR